MRMHPEKKKNRNLDMHTVISRMVDPIVHRTTWSILIIITPACDGVGKRSIYENV